jgi:hypothetical protein
MHSIFDSGRNPFHMARWWQTGISSDKKGGVKKTANFFDNSLI